MFDNNNNNNHNNDNKRTCRIVEFTVPDDNRVKLKEIEKKYKYLDLARDLKKLWHINLSEVPIFICVLGTVKK